MGLITLLKQLIELKKTIYLLGYQLITKDTAQIQEEPDRRDAKGNVYVRRGRGFHALSGCTTLPAHPLVQQPGRFLNPVLLGF